MLADGSRPGCDALELTLLLLLLLSCTSLLLALLLALPLALPLLAGVSLRETVGRRSGLSTAGLGVVTGLAVRVALCSEGEAPVEVPEDCEDLLPLSWDAAFSLLLETLLLLLLPLSVEAVAALATLCSLGAVLLLLLLSEVLALLELAECDSSLETSVLDSSCAGQCMQVKQQKQQ